MRQRRLAFVVPFGEASESFFPDTLLSWLSARARRLGHETRVVRVYYDGRDAARDAEVRTRLSAWLDAFAPTDVLIERTFDLAPLLAARERHGSRLVMVCRGDGFDPDPRLDAWIGRSPGLHRGRTRRSPTVGDLVEGLDALLEDRPASDEPVRALPRVELDLAHDVITLEPDPRLSTPRIRTVLGNAGCPYSADPRRDPFYEGLFRAGPGGDGGPALETLSLLGCAFCPMGGDYQVTPEAELVLWVAAQAREIRRAAPATEALVLSDQAPLPYLARLIAETSELAPLRWLVAMRADVLLRETARLEQTLEVAARHGHRIELYLTGFESFSDHDLSRYLKGVRARELVSAVDAMRSLARRAPMTFSYASAKGHSLILWNPWTTPEALEESLRTIRREGLGELFWDLGRNRLRLTHELPITLAAARDGALDEAWAAGDEGAARRKGYSPERPWRFLDPRAELAHRLAELLRERLGRETELAQLLAAAELARTSEPLDREGTVRAVSEDLAALEASLARWLGAGRKEADPPRGSFVRASVVDLGMQCGCGDPACAERDVWIEPSTAAARLEQALTGAPAAILLAGGDAGLHPELAGLVARARATGAVGLAVPSPVTLPDGLELDALVVDVRTDAPQLARLAASIAPARTDATAVEVRLLLGRGPSPTDPSRTGSSLAGAALALVRAVTETLAPDVVRVVIALDAVGLAELSRAGDEVQALAEACAALRLPFEVSPLSAGPRWRERLPRRRSAR